MIGIYRFPNEKVPLFCVFFEKALKNLRIRRHDMNHVDGRVMCSNRITRVFIFLTCGYKKRN